MRILYFLNFSPYQHKEVSLLNQKIDKYLVLEAILISWKKFLSYWTDIFDTQYKKKFRAWDYRWLYSNWVKNKLSIIPKKHLIQNIGFVKEATHTKIKYKDWFHDLKTEEIKDIKYHPSLIEAEINYDK